MLRSNGPAPRPRVRAHPDDVLRQLARRGRGPTGPTIYVHRRKPFDAVRAAFLVAVGLLLVLGGIASLPFLLPHNEIVVTGLEPVTYVSPATLSERIMTFAVKPEKALNGLKVRIDGQAGFVRQEKGVLRWIPQIGELTEGKHTITLESGGRFLWRGATRRKLTVVVDSIAPTLQVAQSTVRVPVDQPFDISGTVEEDTKVLVNGSEATLERGAFRHRFRLPPIGLIRVEAIDRAGNSTVTDVRSNVELPVLRSVHMSAISWLTPELKDPVMRLAEAGKINAIQLDLKDELGAVGYRSKVPRVADLGANDGCAVQQCYDLASAVAEIHGRGLRFVGRIVVFRDPLLTRAAQNAGRLGDVVQDGTGAPYQSAYGGFANPASESVQNYIFDLVREAAAAGVDDILFDYIRRPEGSLDGMRFPGLETSSAEEIDRAIIDFLSKTGDQLAGTKTRLGVSVFGIAATRPDEIAQNIRAMSRHVDYIAPMVYPSHWRSGYYNVSDPPNQPFEIVSKSVRDFQSQVKGTDAIVVPWLQDFTLGGRKYGAKEVNEQIMASRSMEAQGFLLWDPKVTYNGDGIPADAPSVIVGAVKAPSGSGSVVTAPTVPPLAPAR